MSLFQDYRNDGFYDEMFTNDGEPRPHYKALFERLNGMSVSEYQNRVKLADLTLINQGITFVVYGDEKGSEKPFPFDLIPRIIPADEWRHIEKGLTQRLNALNMFLYDVYHEQHIVKSGVIPNELIVNASNYRREFIGANPPHGIYVHVCGSDLVRDSSGEYKVLEDNLRTPSGVSYVIENRSILTHVLPQLFRDLAVRPVDHYTSQLLQNLRDLAPEGREENPNIVLLTPGVYNSAYFEHSFLAQQLGIELVEGRDLFVEDSIVFMKTTKGPQRVDVIYRRVDDDFLDPLIFRNDSKLGAAGLVNAYRAGNVALSNSVGTGIADDKAIYAYVPKMIKFYLDQDPILPNIETFLGYDPNSLKHILENLDKLVVKAANESGGYGMLMGPQSTQDEREDFKRRIMANPRNYIAQPLVSISRSPAFVGESCEGRHIDLRPYILCGKSSITMIPGGLTRVALKKGSYVVNSSQGGGSKDTWVLADKKTSEETPALYQNPANSVRLMEMSQTLGGMTQSMGSGMYQSFNQEARDAQ